MSIWGYPIKKGRFSQLCGKGTLASLLLHTCCVHCSAYVVDYWQSQEFKVTLFWYNPNIHPYLEYQRRLEAVITFADSRNLPIIADQNYDLVRFFQAVTGHETERCRWCFYLRLQTTAKIAQGKGFPTFTTTLLISPHQKHYLLKEIGEMVAKETGLAFLYHDLRRHYSESRCQTKKLNLYRQQYCGCLYSELERYSKIR